MTDLENTVHLPEGMLSIPVTAFTGLLALGALRQALAWVHRHLDERQMVLMAVLGALIFALQLLNFPIQAGTSGHFAGGALAGILLGPWPAVLVMTAVLGVQALLFADGGIIALGANILNLGLIAPLVGYAVYRTLLRLGWGHANRPVGTSGTLPRPHLETSLGQEGTQIPARPRGERQVPHQVSGPWLRPVSGPWLRLVAAFLGAWLATLLAALAVALELGLSGTAHLGLASLAMGTTHALIGIGEGLVTAALVAYLHRVRPDLLGAESGPSSSWPLGGVLVSLAGLAILAASLSFLASAAPDGLEHVYFNLGIGDVQAIEQAPRLLGDGGPLADYRVAGVEDESLGSAIAGLIGLTVVGGLLALLAIRWRRAAK